MAKMKFGCSLFGYNKMQVCEYMAQLNEEYYEHLHAAQAEHDEREAQFEAQLAAQKQIEMELRAKIEALYREKEGIQQERDAVATVLLEAQAHSQTLKAQAEADAAQFREENRKKLQNEQNRIQRYTSDMEALLCSTRLLLTQLEAELTPLQEKMCKDGAELCDTDGAGKNEEGSNTACSD